MQTFKHAWRQKFQIFFQKLLFLLWTVVLIYSIGPYYAIVEFIRNLQIFGYKKLDYDKEFKDISLEGKVCVITGGTRGIGFEVVRYLLSKNCNIITGTSSLRDDACEKTILQYKRKVLANIEDREDKTNLESLFNVFPLNLSSLDSVTKFSDRIKKTNSKIDYLICNGGVMLVPFKLSHDRFEQHMIINYYSHCLLIAKLLTLLVSNKEPNQRSRIIMVSSGAHNASFGLRLHDLNSTNFFSTYHQYCQSKLCQIMFTYRLNQWIQNAKIGRIHLKDMVTINCLHPGMCRTRLMEAFNFTRIKLIRNLPFLRSAAEGAETILFTTLSRKMDTISGKYFEDCSSTKSNALSYETSLQNQLWTKTWQDLKQWLTNDEISLFF